MGRDVEEGGVVEGCRGRGCGGGVGRDVEEEGVVEGVWGGM